MKLKHNIPLLYIYSVLAKRITMPIIVLYFLLNNITLTEVGIIAAGFAGANLLFEIPGGMFADTFGKKTSLMLFPIFAFFSMVLYFIGNSFWYFLIAGVLFGLGVSFGSGTREAVLYETLLKLKKQEMFKKYFGRIIFYSHIFNALFLVLVPIVYAFNPKLPFIIGAFMYTLMFFVSLLIFEPITIRKKLIFLKTFKSAINEIFSNKLLFFLIIAFALSLGFNYTAAEFAQPTFQLTGISVVFFGLIYGGKRLVMGLGGMITHSLDRFFNSKVLILIATFFLIISFVFFASLFWILVISAFLLLGLSEGITKVVFENSLNKRIKPEARTTILSIKSLSVNMTKIIIVIPLAAYADLFGLGEMFKIATLLFLIVFIVSLVIYKLIRN